LAASAPNSPLAQTQFAFNTAFILDQIPREDRAEALAAARRAADRTIELAPEFGGAYIPGCFLRSEQQMVGCEAGLRKGMRMDPDNSFVNWFLSRLLNNAGRNIEAAELAKLSLAHDPYMPYKIAQMLRMLETNGQMGEAAKLYEQSKQWWPDNDTIQWYRISGMILRGDFRAVQQFKREVQPKAEDPVLSAINSKSLGRMRSACPAEVAEDQAKGFECMLALARYGDLDAAFGLADRLYPPRRGRTPADEERIWLDKPGANMLAFLSSPAGAPLRRDPRYFALAERVGLVEYWRSGRPPDFCRNQPESICAQLLKRA
jgi:tetratricopeptide (TPR) repeat protein